MWSRIFLRGVLIGSSLALVGNFACSPSSNSNDKTAEVGGASDAAALTTASSPVPKDPAQRLGNLIYNHRIEDLGDGKRIITFEYPANEQGVVEVTFNYKLSTQEPKQWQSLPASCQGVGTLVNCFAEVSMHPDGDYMQYNISFVRQGVKYETKDYFDTNSPRFVRDGAESFTEDFDGGGLSTSKWWSHFDYNPPNAEVHCYVPFTEGGQKNTELVSTEISGYEGRRKENRYLALKADSVDDLALPAGCKNPNVPSSQQKKFTSGKIITNQSFKHGRFEIRARVPNGFGVFPAIWLLPIDGAWPATGELDIMEHVGSSGKASFTSTIIYHHNYDVPGAPTTAAEGEKDTHRRWSFDVPGGAPLSADFHVYAMEWTEDSVAYFFDGIEVFKVNKSDMTQPFKSHKDLWDWDVAFDAHGNKMWGVPYEAPACPSTACWPYNNHKMSLIINLALLDTWLPTTDEHGNTIAKPFAPDPNALKDPVLGHMLVDYVHVYRPRNR